MNDRAISAAVPTVHQACWPKTSYSAREPDPGSSDSEPSSGRTSVPGSVTDAPGSLPVRSRVGVGRTLRPGPRRRQWHPRPESAGRRWSGASTHRPGTLVPGASDAPPRGAPRRASARLADTLSPCPVRSRVVALPSLARRSLVLAALRRRRRPPRSTRPAPCTARRRGARRLPGARGARPDDLSRGSRRETLDSGRNCSPANLGSLAVAGHRRGPLRRRRPGRSGRARRVVLAVFRRPGLTADARSADVLRRPSAGDRRTGPRSLGRVRRRRSRGRPAAAGSTPRPATRHARRVVGLARRPTAGPGRRSCITARSCRDARDPREAASTAFGAGRARC